MKPMFALVLLLGSGCAQSRMVERHTKTLPHAPLNDPGKGGRVVYTIGGEDGVAGRAQAYQQMAETCGGPYRIAKEYDGAPVYKIGGAAVGFGVPTMLTGNFLFGQASPNTPRVIEFQCEESPLR